MSVNPKKSRTQKHDCEKMKNNWLFCQQKYKGAANFSKGSTLCNNKLKEYLYSCGDKDERKRFVCSILATH
jgi:hypothetical protein|tara:strand:+ start:22 stop:234 length:213 start_codon:yes stop_codon:yes gene_type:complete